MARLRGRSKEVHRKCVLPASGPQAARQSGHQNSVNPVAGGEAQDAGAVKRAEKSGKKIRGANRISSQVLMAFLAPSCFGNIIFPFLCFLLINLFCLSAL